MIGLACWRLNNKKGENSMTKTASLRIINQAFPCIIEALDNVSMSHYGRLYYGINLSEEKDHRRFCPDGIQPGLTLHQGARLFFVKQLADYLEGDRMPTVAEFIHIRQSVFLAASLVANYREVIAKAFEEAKVNPAECRSLDYAVLNKSIDRIAA